MLRCVGDGVTSTADCKPMLGNKQSDYSPISLFPASRPRGLNSHNMDMLSKDIKKVRFMRRQSIFLKTDTIESC